MKSSARTMTWPEAFWKKRVTEDTGRLRWGATASPEENVSLTEEWATSYSERRTV